MTPQGIFTFTDIDHVLGGTVAYDARGISPSTFLLTIAPQQNLAIDDGTLSIEFGGTICQLPGCAVVGHTRDTLAGANVYRVRIVDRRWRWSYGQISGEYNVRRDANQANFVLGTARNPQQLASLCLDAMNEVNYDVSQLPKVARPYIHWEREVPAEALSQLVESLGCRVVLNPYTNSVKIERVGIGQPLDPTDRMTDSQGVTRAPLPARIVVSTEPIRFQLDLVLQPVGEDTDGRIVPIENLSYWKAWFGDPQNDWDFFNHVFKAVKDNGGTDEEALHAQDCAKRSVARWWRIETPFELLNYGQVTALSSFEVEDRLIEVTRGPDGNFQRAPAFIYGFWHNYKVDTEDRASSIQSPTGSIIISNPPIPRLSPLAELYELQLSTTDRSIIVGTPTTIQDGEYRRTGFAHIPSPKMTWTLDRDSKIVRFSAPALSKVVPSSVVRPAYLVIRCTIMVLISRQPWRLEIPHVLGGAGGDLILARPDVEPAVIFANGLSPDGSSPTPVGIQASNLTFCAQQADHYIREIEKTLLPVDSQTITYAGFKRVEPDGARSIITWELSERGATTTASYNDEQPRLLTTYQQKRLQERTAAAMRKREIRINRPTQIMGTGF